MPQKQNDGPTPFPLAILLCDDIIVDEGTKKKTLVGVFSSVLAAGFPTIRQMKLYARLTDAQGIYNFRLDYVQIKTDEILAQAEIRGLEIPDRLKPIEVIGDPPPLPIPEAGEYEFRLWSNDRYIGRITFTATERAKEGDQG